MIVLFEGQTVTEILKAMLSGIDSRRHTFVVVPDRFSLEAETMLLDATEQGAAVLTEVTTLARLAERLCDPDRRKLSAEGSVMAIASIIHAQAERLMCLKNNAFSGAAEEIYATVEQLIASNVEPEDLQADETDLALFRKLHDLKLIYGAYRDFLKQGYGDAANDICEAARNVSTAAFIFDSDFYVVGYDDLTKSNLRLLSEIAAHAHRLIVGAVHADYAFGGTTLFQALQNVCAEVVKVPSLLSPLKRKICASIDDECAAPFSFRDCARSGENLEVLIAPDVAAGIERIARDISEGVQNGERYRDYCIMAESGDVEATAEALTEFSIPVNADCAILAAQDPLARLIVAVLECATKRYATGAVRKLALNPTFGIGAEDYAAWDNYVTRFGVDHSRHLVPYRIEHTDVAAAERVRSAVMEQASGTVDALSRATTMGECVAACRQMLDGAHDKVRVIRERFLPESVDFSEQAEDKLLEILDNLDYSASTPMTADVFLGLFNAGVKAAKIRVTPTYADAVNVFTADSFGFRRYRHLYMLGADDGKLPITQADCGLISDSDIDRLSKIGAAIDPKISEVNARARYRVFAAMLQGDAVTAVVTAEQPNYFAKRLTSKFMALTTRTDEDALAFEETADEDARRAVLRMCANNAVAKRSARRLMDLARARGEARLSPSVSALVTATDCFENVSGQENSLQGVSGDELFFLNKHTSVSQIERFFDCPYQHFLTYGLRLTERPSAEVRANDVGTFLHAVAERFVTEHVNDLSDCDKAAKRIAERVIQVTPVLCLDADNVEVARKSLMRESKLLCRRLYDYKSRTDFVTEKAESRFGEDLSAISIQGLSMKGVIDRVDGLGDQVAIIDYKSGSANYSLTDVYYGRKMQLFVYMSALKKCGRKPAAMLYFPISADYGENKTKCHGWVSSDLKTIEHLDKTLTAENPESKFLPIGFNKTQAKSGKVALKSQENAFSSEDFDEWLTYTDNLVGCAVADIRESMIKPSPFQKNILQSPCQYCEGRSACVAHPCARAHSGTVKKDCLNGNAVSTDGKEEPTE